MLKQLSPWTALVLVAAIFTLGGCVALGRIQLTDAAVAGIVAALLAQMPKLFAGPQS